jgi:acetyltransferase-like isoleucine patch superfamily enzyme
MGGFKPSQKKIDVDTLKSDSRGLAWYFETSLRRFKNLTQLVMLAPLYLMGCGLIGLALLPGVLMWQWVHSAVSEWPHVYKTFALTTAGAAAYFCYGFSVVLLVPALNVALRIKLKPWRGQYYSAAAVPWYIHNGTTYLVRYTILELITPTPLNIFFYKLMGMKIGRGTIINTSAISDPCLISIGEKVTIGGSVTIVGHYGQGGFLVLAPVKIGNRVTIGLKASIMGGVEIGDEAKIMPHSAVLPKTIIPAGETWGGVPAVRIEAAEEPSQPIPFKRIS